MSRNYYIGRRNMMIGFWSPKNILKSFLIRNNKGGNDSEDNYE